MIQLKKKMNLAEGYLKGKQIHKNQADFGGGGAGLVELLRSQNKAAGDKTGSWELFSEQLWSVCSHWK